MSEAAFLCVWMAIRIDENAVTNQPMRRASKQTHHSTHCHERRYSVNQRVRPPPDASQGFVTRSHQNRRESRTSRTPGKVTPTPHTRHPASPGLIAWASRVRPPPHPQQRRCAILLLYLVTQPLAILLLFL